MVPDQQHPPSVRAGQERLVQVQGEEQQFRDDQQRDRRAANRPPIY
jgi:hypothetical protein